LQEQQKMPFRWHQNGLTKDSNPMAFPSQQMQAAGSTFRQQLPPGSMAQPYGIDADQALPSTRRFHSKTGPANPAFADGYKAGLEMILQRHAKAGNAGAALQQRRMHQRRVHRNKEDPDEFDDEDSTGLKGSYKGDSSAGETFGDCIHNENGTWTCIPGAGTGEADWEWDEEPDGEQRLVLFVPEPPRQWQWYDRFKETWNQDHRRRGTWRWISGQDWADGKHNLDVMDQGEPQSSVDESIVPQGGGEDGDHEHEFRFSTEDLGWDMTRADEYSDMDRRDKEAAAARGATSLIQAPTDGVSKERVTMRREHPLAREQPQRNGFPQEAVKELQTATRRATDHFIPMKKQVGSESAIDFDQVMPNMQA